MAENKKKKLPRSFRKFIRREKARIRREVLDIGEQKELITRLYAQFSPKNNSAKATDEIKNQSAKIKMTIQNSK